MSDHEDLELQALQRQLDDAFETTRPRRGFEEELWLRIQSHRPVWTRLQDSVAGLLRAIRESPRVPAAAVAALLVVVIGAGVVTLSGSHLGGSTSSTSGGAARYSGEAPMLGAPASFGRLPAPALYPGQPGAASVGQQTDTAQPSVKAAANLYFGPATLTWTGQLSLGVTSATVFRYREPSTSVADQFATSLGASARSRPASFLGQYASSDFTLRVRGTVQVPPQEPSYLLVPSASPPSPMPSGAGPAESAQMFLAQHSLAVQWPNTVEVTSSADQTIVRLIRQFDVAGYGSAALVDSNGERYGLEVDLKRDQLAFVAGPLPLSLDSADYRIISTEQAVASALASSPAQPGGPNPPPAVQLTKADLVYALVAAGDHSFYEPAILFSGTFVMNGTTYSKRVLVPAVDPSQRSS